MLQLWLDFKIQRFCSVETQLTDNHWGGGEEEENISLTQWLHLLGSITKALRLSREQFLNNTPLISNQMRY